ncbi:MAG: aquaporin [Phycisphaerales bacterium]
MTPKLVTEFIGSFFWVLIAALAAVYAGPLAPVAVGVGVMALAYMGSHVSGGHYNPAVTLAAFLRGKLQPAAAIAYVVVQLAGAAAGAVTARGITGQLLLFAPGDHVTSTAALTVEALFTFVLALVVLNATTARQTQGNSYFGAAVGGTVLVAILAGGKVSGGAFNPAVALGPALAGTLTGAAVSSLWWIYLAGPCIGAAAAALVFRVQKQE